ncbi:hypothetical protein PT2222_160085 [Paraburkholderia tropica]
MSAACQQRISDGTRQGAVRARRYHLRNAIRTTQFMQTPRAAAQPAKRAVPAHRVSRARPP